MATYNDLPTEITANIFSYLRHERRKPDHCLVIKGMFHGIDDNVDIRDDKVWIQDTIYETLGNFLDYDTLFMDAEEEYPGSKWSPFSRWNRKWYNWWKDERNWRLIALWYINIVSACLNEEDYGRILDAYVGENDNDVDEYINADNYSVVISGWWRFSD